MKKILSILIINLMLFSCNGQNNKEINNNMKQAPYNISEEGEGLKFNYDSLSSKLIEHGKKSLKNMNFKFPSNQVFHEKIKEIYNWDINEYSNKNIALNNSMFPYIAIKDENYILFQDSDIDSEFLVDQIDLYHYNNYIFNDNRASYNILRAKNSILLKDLVVLFGYNKDIELTKYVLNNFNFSDKISFHDLLFSYNPENSKYQLRKGIMDDIENFIYNGKTEDFSYAKEGSGYISVSEVIQKIEDQKNNYINPDETIAYLYDKTLQVGITGYIQEKLDISPDYKIFLKKNNFFKLDRLKEYVEIIYQSSGEDEGDNNRFYIEDKDGFTNLRKEKSSSSEVLQKIKSGEQVEVLDNTGDWWQVKTKEGKTGYVHKSRIKSSNNHSTSYKLYDRPDFQSYAQEVIIKGEIEYLHQVSGWDFVKVNGITGYLATEELKKEQQEIEKKKYTFLADEDEVKNKKKKGFWDNLFG